MPIYEQTYKPWEGVLESRPRTWWVIARTGIQLLMRKGMAVFMLFAYFPFFFRAVQIYMIARFGDKLEIVQKFKGLKIDANFYSDFINGQMFFVILIFVFVGAGLIANDKRFKALSLYFSKPVGFRDYILGKFLALGFFVSLITLVPGLLLFLMRVVLAKDTVYIQDFFWIPFSLLCYTVVELLMLGSVILVLSASSKGTRSAAVFFFTLIMFPDLIRIILSKIPAVGLISMTADIKQMGSIFFGIEQPCGFSPVLAFLVLGAVVVLSVFQLKRRVKPTEVIR